MIGLITSAAYVNPEMSAEFGELPPSFLPLGLSRLYEHQAALLSSLDGLFLSIPSSFDISDLERQRIKDVGLTTISVPENMSLGRSIAFCMDAINIKGDFLILHGDTVFGQIVELENDCMSVSVARDQYAWAYPLLEDDRIVGVLSGGVGDDGDLASDLLSGLFKFSDAETFRLDLKRANYDFVTALARYCLSKPVKPLRVEGWLDLGHLQTYCRSRAAFAASRAFNSLAIREGIVRKTSNQANKLRAEAAWLRDVPTQLKPFTVRLLSEKEIGGAFSYETEYAYLPTLAELFVFGRIGRRTWTSILESCFRFLDLCARFPGDTGMEACLERLVVGKTRKRLDEFAETSELNLNDIMKINGQTCEPVNVIAEQMADIVRRDSSEAPGVMHGDFCFSNILFDARTNQIKCLDPRGSLDGGGITVFGDSRYDMAKLAHSVVGLYDLIIAGRYRLDESVDELGRVSFQLEFDLSDERLWLAKVFMEAKVRGLRFSDPVVIATMVSLFLSMLPLHADRPDRQRAFLANALLLHQRFFGVLS